jgi:hypothetical protein
MGNPAVGSGPTTTKKRGSPADVTKLPHRGQLCSKTNLRGQHVLILVNSYSVYDAP